MRSTILAIVAVGLLGGCRASVERDEPQRTVVVQQDGRTDPGTKYDTAEPHPQRLEIVVTDPRTGEAAGPSPLAPLVGRNVKVQFRRDALGVAAGAPISPTAQGPGGRAVHLVGTVRSVTGGWLVLERERNTCWIPHSTILVIEQTESPPATLPAVE